MKISDGVKIAVITGLFGLVQARNEFNHTETKDSVDTLQGSMRKLWQVKHSKDSLADVRRDSITWMKQDSILSYLRNGCEHYSH